MSHNFAYAETEAGRGNERVHIIIALIYKFSIVMQFSEAGSINQILKICFKQPENTS